MTLKMVQISFAVYTFETNLTRGEGDLVYSV